MKQLLLAVLPIVAACGEPSTPADAATNAKTLIVTAIPDNNPDQTRERQATLSDWLSRETGLTVRFHPVADYAAAVVALKTGQAHMAWLGGVTTVQAMQQSNGKIVPLVMREKDRHFHSYIIASKALNAASVQDLKGRSFTFGNVSSTSGHVMPRYLLGKEFGIVPETFFGSVAYSGNHAATIRQVADGAVDAGAVNYVEFDQLKAQNDPLLEKLQVLWTTPDYVDYAYNVRTDLDELFGAGATAKLRDAFVGLDPQDPADQQILKIQSADRYVAAQAEWWEGITQVLNSDTFRALGTK